MRKLITLFLSPTPESLRQQQLQKLRLLRVNAELSLDQVTADLQYLSSAIKRLESQC
jgi:hypothetical protein